MECGRTKRSMAAGVAVATGGPLGFFASESEDEDDPEDEELEEEASEVVRRGGRATGEAAAGAFAAGRGDALGEACGVGLSSVETGEVAAIRAAAARDAGVAPTLARVPPRGTPLLSTRS